MHAFAVRNIASDHRVTIASDHRPTRLAAVQERILSKRPAIVTATPGRLWDMMSGGGGTAAGGGSTGGVASKHLTNVSSLDFLIIDEADRMVQDNHFEVISQHSTLLPADPSIFMAVLSTSPSQKGRFQVCVTGTGMQ